MTCWPTRRVSESPIRAPRMALVTRSSCRSETSAAHVAETLAPRTPPPPMPSTVISSMPLTTWAAVMTLPSLETRTPEPVSVKRVIPPAPTSRPLLRTTRTVGLTRVKRSSRLGLWALAAGAKAGKVATTTITERIFFMGLLCSILWNDASTTTLVDSGRSNDATTVRSEDFCLAYAAGPAGALRDRHRPGWRYAHFPERTSRQCRGLQRQDDRRQRRCGQSSRRCLQGGEGLLHLRLERRCRSRPCPLDWEGQMQGGACDGGWHL